VLTYGTRRPGGLFHEKAKNKNSQATVLTMPSHQNETFIYSQLDGNSVRILRTDYYTLKGLFYKIEMVDVVGINRTYLIDEPLIVINTVRYLLV
jgi:hypothetical protein